MSSGPWHNRCLSLTWLMTRWGLETLEGSCQGNPHEWCWAPCGPSPEECMRAACLQKVIGRPEFLSGEGEESGREVDWPTNRGRLLRSFKVSFCLSAQLATKSLADRLPVTVVLVQYSFHCGDGGAPYYNPWVRVTQNMGSLITNSKQQNKRRQD